MRGEGGAECAVRARIANVWRNWRELARLLVNQGIPLANRAQVLQAWVRPVLLYGAEIWALTKQLEILVRSCDARILRYMTNTRGEDQAPNNEVGRRCALESLVVVLKRARLRWLGHVVRRDEGHIVK